MKSKQNQSNNIGLQQKNSIIQAWINFKDSIFNVLFVLLDKNQDDQAEESLWGLAFQTGLDYLQMMAFPFDMAVIKVWNGGETLENVIGLFQKLNISSYLPGVSFQAFLVLLYSLILLIILVILDIIYVSYSFSKKKFRFTWPLILLAQIVPLFVTVFFLPMTQTLLSVVQCQVSQKGMYQVMQSFPEVICWQGWHLFHAAVTLLFVSIFVFISCVVALALFEPRMTTNKLTARQNSTAQVVFIINKIVCQFIFSFTPFDDTWIYCIMLFGFSFWQFWCYMVNEPYYNKKATKFFKVVSTYYFWTNLMLMVSQILSLWNFNGGLVIWLGGLPFLFVIILFERKSNIGRLFSSNLKFRNGEQLQNHITYVLQLIQNQKKDKHNYMLLIGYIQKHKQICIQEDCPFNKNTKKRKKKNNNQKNNKKNNKDNKNDNEMQQNCIRLLKQLQRMYRTGIKKYPQCTKLRLSFAFFHLQRTRNKNKAYEQFSNAQQTDPSFQQQFIIYRFKKIIRENLQDDDNGGGSDLIEMIRFDNHISLCEEAMLMSARLHKEFWTELKEEIPNLKKLNDIGSMITQTGNAVKQNFMQITKINSSVPEILYNYAVYLLLIIEDYTQGRELLANAKKLYHDKLIGDQFGDQSNANNSNNNANSYKYSQEFYQNNNNDRVLTPILVINRNEAKLGKVINCNLMLTQLSGYYKEQLCQRDFHRLLPLTYAAAHQYTLQDWNRRQQMSEYFQQQNQGFIKQKSGLIVPVSYTIKYNIVQEQFIVQLKVDTGRAVKCVILTDSMGLIKQYNSMAKNYLKLISIPSVINNINNNKKDTNLSQTIYLQQLGISDFQSYEYKQGVRRSIKIDEGQKQCIVKIRAIVMKVEQQQQFNNNHSNSNIGLQNKNNTSLVHSYKQNRYNDNITTEDDILQPVKMTIGYIVQITPIMQTKHRFSQNINLSQQKLNSLTNINHIQNKYQEILQKNQQNRSLQQQNQSTERNNLLINTNTNNINTYILDLYNKPVIQDELIGLSLEHEEISINNINENINSNNKSSAFIPRSPLNKKKLKQTILHKFQLTQKIKTMRLLDNQIKMVYNQSNDNDYNSGRQGMDLQDDRQIFKFDDENYQSKLRKAINTNINHVEISRLKNLSFLFLIILFVLIGVQLKFSTDNMQQIQQYAGNILVKAKQLYSLSRFITGSLVPLYQNSVYQKQMREYNVQFSSNQRISFKIENSVQLQEKQFKDVLILMHSKLIEYYTTGNIYTLDNVYYNFVNYIYEGFIKHVIKVMINRIPPYICIGIIVFFTLIMICYWIYISLQVDKKKYDIMIWFLDIPIPYVSHLSIHCDKYLKQFIGIKQLMQKHVNLDQMDQTQYKQYNQNNQQNKQQQIQQQIKARKSLIAKHRKQTIFSKLNITYLVMLWLLVYSSMMSVLMLVSSQIQYDNYQFLDTHWGMTARHVFWGGALDVAMILKHKNKNIIGDVNVSRMIIEIKRNHLNYISETNTIKFNKDIMDYIPEIEEKYRTVYYQTLCSNKTDVNSMMQCDRLLSGKLSVGYTVYSKYLVNAPVSQHLLIRQANEKHVIPELIGVLQSWQLITRLNILKTISLCSILLYVYVIMSMLFFSVFWLMYLKGMNTQLNQTIQMLNMIPFKLLPKSRKQTKQFITWIIKEANKKKHQAQ